eukprot:705940-Rhodomonas_salina.1
MFSPRLLARTTPPPGPSLVRAGSFFAAARDVCVVLHVCSVMVQIRDQGGHLEHCSLQQFLEVTGAHALYRSDRQR